MNTREIFYTNLNKYISMSGKNKKTISEEMGIPYTTLAEWANGKKFPRADGIERLATYFKIEKSDLLEEKNITPTLAHEYNMILSAHEKELLLAYRAKPEMQASIDKLLDITPVSESTIADDIVSTINSTSPISSPISKK